MTNTLYIPVTKRSTSLNGLVSLFVHNWSGNTTLLTLVDHPSDSESPSFPVDVASPGKIDPEFALLTTLPLLVVVGDRENFSQVVVSGLAAVCRHVIKESNDPAVCKALGFRGNCLQAPAECSIWTSFCEVQMVQSAVAFLTRPIDSDLVEIPSALVRLEEHLKQPVRMHNVVKRWQDEAVDQPSGQLDLKEIQKRAATWVDHTFAEGPDMTLADLLLFPCVTVLAERLSALGIKLGDHLPRVGRWLATMNPLVERAWIKTVGHDALLDMTSLRIQPPAIVKIPRVKEGSLYKRDTTRPGLGNLSAEEIPRVIDLFRARRLWLEGNEDGKDVDLPSDWVSHIDIATCSDFIARIDWSSLPDPAHPHHGHVPGK